MVKFGGENINIFDFPLPRSPMRAGIDYTARKAAHALGRTWDEFLALECDAQAEIVALHMTTLQEAAVWAELEKAERNTE